MTIVTDPVLAPITFGVKLTVIVQLAAAATDAPQSFVTANSPLAKMLEIFITALAVFVSVTFCALLVVVHNCSANVRSATERLRVDGFRKLTLRMRWLLWSAMKRLPAPSRATPKGKAKLALVAGPPSPLNPEMPFPATVVMIPEVSTLRMRLFN